MRNWRSGLRWRSSEPALLFLPEWLCVAALILADIRLAPHFKLYFGLSWHDANLIALPLLAIAILIRKLGGRRAGLTTEFFALMLAAAPALVVMTYIAAVAAGPLRDAAFLAADRMLGFDWLAWFHFITMRPFLAASFKFLYWSLNFQAFYFCILMGITGNLVRLREIFWLVSLSLALTALGSWLAPAMGPFETFHLKSWGVFLPEMKILRLGLPVYRTISQMQGIVTFPSFHTTMAFVMIYAFRGMSVITWLIAAADLIMLLGVPVFGGHYLMDMLAGALVFALALLAVRAAPRSLRRLAGSEQLAPAS